MIFQKLQQMIAQQLGIELSKITPDSDIINDIHADSLDIVELLMSVESEWGIEIDDSEVADMKTVGDVVSFIEAKAK